MDDNGYAFTPIAFVLMIPVIIVAVSYGSIVNEVNLLSAIVIGGDVTATVSKDITAAIQEDTADAGRVAAFVAVETVINNTQLVSNNHPFFGNTSGNNSTTFILNEVTGMLNTNLTNTCRVLENQTGRSVYINGIYIDPNSDDNVTIFPSGSLAITQSDPFGFNITVPAVPISVVQNGANGQNVTFSLPSQNVYVSIQGLEDPYIWVNTKERNSSVIYAYPYYTSGGLFSSSTDDYHFADKVSAGKLEYLYECLIGQNVTEFGDDPYYFPDTHGLSFFDRLENRSVANSGSPPDARMSTFILWDPLSETHVGSNLSCIDHEYFTGVLGYPITTTHNSIVTTVIGPDNNPFLISTAYQGYLNLKTSYNY